MNSTTYQPKEIRREIRWLAIPIIVESLFALSGNIIFIALLGRIDSVGLSSITHVAVQGMASLITGMVWWLLKGIGIGATIRIAQAYGAGDENLIRKLGLQTLELQFTLGLICSLLLWLGAEFLVGFYNPDPELAKLSIQYIQICCFGFPFLGIMHSSTGILQGIGDTKSPMKFSAILNVVFIVAGVPLIYGWIGEPLGVLGSAYALVLGQVLTATFGLYALFRKRKVLYIDKENKDYLPDFHTMLNVASVGLPTSFENIFWQFAAMLIGRLMLAYGELPYAANQIGLQAEAIALMPASSFGIVTVTLSGRALGAKNNELGRTYIQEIKKSSLPLIGFGAILLVVFPIPLLRILSNNEDVVQLAAVYLRLMGIALPFMTLSQVYMGVLKSTGMAKLPLYISMGALWLVRVPLCFLTARFEESQITWLWVVIFIDLVTRYVLTSIIYKRKRIFQDDFVA